jgi:AraC-like DNA-binding protein
MNMHGQVKILNTYVSPLAAKRLALPEYCKVLNISALLKNLLMEAAGIPTLYRIDQREGRIMALLLDEIAAMPVLPLKVSLPSDPRLARACRDLIENPQSDATIEEMAAKAGVSRRTFTRLIREETGLSFAAWKQQVCLLAAIGRIHEGEPITRVAVDLGYSSPSAFTVAFKRVLGEAPSKYLENS